MKIFKEVYQKTGRINEFKQLQAPDGTLFISSMPKLASIFSK